MPIRERCIQRQGTWPRIRLLLLVVIGFILLTSCGNGEDEAETPTPLRPSPLPSPTPVVTLAPTPPAQPLLPCYTDIAAVRAATPVASPTPEVIRVQLLDSPYRMVPRDIVLRQHRWYRFFVSAEGEWQTFRVNDLGMSIVHEIPPGGEVEFVFQATRAGVFIVENWRRIQESRFSNSITVVPEGNSALTWHPASCGTLVVRAPTPGAQLSPPFVVQGTFEEPYGSPLHVDRIEAWIKGELVGVATSAHFIPRGPQTDFLLAIPSLASGRHNVRVQVFLQNGTVVATASLPVKVLDDPVSETLPAGYRGSVDRPVASELLSLPVTVEGWVVIPGSKQGTGVGIVEIWNGSRGSGQFLTEAAYGTYRPDVAQVLGDPRFASSGFIAHLSDLPAGPVDLNIYVRDRESQGYVARLSLEAPLSRRFMLAEGKVTDAAWPVALAAAPDGRLFYAELFTGNIRIWQNGQLDPRPFATLENVSNHRESGFLGLALHPDFPQTPYVYAMYVVDDPETGLPSGQRVVRFRDVNNVGQDYTVVLDNLPATTVIFHNGGRIAFGPDGKLYLTIGDTDVPALAQDPTRLEGSILRYNPDGSIPDDNPIPGSPVYATGLRNVFGLAFHPGTGDLYATDNGPGGFDEVNKIEAGHNYGWPTRMGAANREGFSDPIAVFGIWPYPPIGPTGVAFAPDHPDLLLFCAYHGFSLRALPLSGQEVNSAESTPIISNNCALDITYSSDGWLYYSSISAIYRARLDDLLRLHEQRAH